MKPQKRKLKADDAPLEQFQALRQLPRLSFEDCRQVIGLLREDAIGHRTVAREHHAYPAAAKLVRQLWSGENKDVAVYANSLPDLLQAKVEACPLFARLLYDAWKQYDGLLTFVVFSDDATPGNILAARQPKKSCMMYRTFLELPVLFDENSWLPLSNIRVNELTEQKFSHAEYLRCVLEFVHDTTQYGMAITLQGEAVLVRIRKMIVLGDHEGLRSFAGCKGAAGLKPCWRCCNVISGQRDLPPNHVHLGCSDTSLWRPQTDDGLMAVLAHLRGCNTKKSLQEAEKFLGWSLASTEKGIFGSTMLRSMISLESLYVDSMHQFYSNGLVNQDVGLWYSTFKRCGFDLALLQRWACIGWKTLGKGPSPKACLSDKLFREDSDFRGDAETSLQILPLIYGFTQEMLANQEAMQVANQALAALYDVTLLLQKTKICPEAATQLTKTIQRYKQRWDLAYAAIAGVRPKFHWSLHLQAQIQMWKRHIDCFPGERKHRVFKSTVAPRLSKLSCFTRSTLLQMTEQELTTGHQENEYTGRLVGKPKVDVLLAKQFDISPETTFAKGVQIQCIEYLRGTFLQMSATRSIEILHGLMHRNILSVVVQPLQACTSKGTILKWKRFENQKEILAASVLLQKEPMRLLREDQTGLWLLR